jgi:hypothetical protein
MVTAYEAQPDMYTGAPRYFTAGAFSGKDPKCWTMAIRGRLSAPRRCARSPLLGISNIQGVWPLDFACIHARHAWRLACRACELAS